MRSLRRPDRDQRPSPRGVGVMGTPSISFPLGRTVATPGALAAMLQAGENPLQFLARHSRRDWGDLEPEDRRENELSLRKGFRLLSAYQTRLVKLQPLFQFHRTHQASQPLSDFFLFRGRHLSKCVRL